MSNIAQKPSSIMPKIAKEKRAEKAIIFLYLFFFFLWGSGYLLGIIETDLTTLFGLPLWFFMSCIIAFLFTTLALHAVVKSYFQ